MQITFIKGYIFHYGDWGTNVYKLNNNKPFRVLIKTWFNKELVKSIKDIQLKDIILEDYVIICK